MVMRKLFTAVRGAGNEIGESIQDAQAFRILEQEIRDARRALDGSIRDLSGAMALEIAERRRLDDVSARIAKDETLAHKAMDANEEALALEIAERITEGRGRHDACAVEQTALAARVRQMRSAIAETERRIATLRRELALARSAASLQRVEGAVARDGGSAKARLADAEETLKRIKARIQNHADQSAAATIIIEQHRGTALDSRLRDAGILEPDRPTAAAVLEDLRAARPDGDTSPGPLRPRGSGRAPGSETKNDHNQPKED